MKLAVGARIRKNHAPRNPHIGLRISAQSVAASRIPMTIAAGTVFRRLTVIGQP